MSPLTAAAQVEPEEEFVVAVDEHDREIGVLGKMAAHRLGVLHRAFSVFVFDPADGTLLLQQRAAAKYHSGALWSNTCCSHPRPGESVNDAATRRLREEMGVACDLQWVGSFRYRAELDRGLVEHEIDHLLVGWSDTAPRPDPAEVGGWRQMPLDALHADMHATPERYTAWMHLALPRLLAAMGGGAENTASSGRTVIARGARPTPAVPIA